MASQLRVDEIIASTGSSVAIGTAGESVTISGEFSVDASKGLNVGTGATIFSPSSNVLTLGTNSAERVRINSSGSVGIGTNNPDVALHILSNTTGFKVQRDDESLSINPNYAGQSHCAFELTNALSIRTGSGSQNERLRITSSGNVGIGTDNPYDSKLQVFGKQRVSASAKDLTTDFFVLSSNDNSSTRNELIFRQRASDNDWEIEAVEQNTGYHNVWIKNGNLKFTSGKGIDFSATADGPGTTSSEILNDYEEGTWTPTDTSTGVTFSSSDGRYRKVGSIVVAYGNVQFPVNSNSASVGISLPFTSGGGRPGGFIRYTDSGLYFSMHVNATTAQVVPYLNSGSAVINSQMSNKRLDFEVIYSTTT